MSQPVVNIGMVGHIDHGKTTLLEKLSGQWASRHSEELKSGITIRLGYADASFYKCPECKGVESYSVTKECSNCGGTAKLIRRLSFVDAPGHETLMATMLSGAAVIDGAILVIAANEPCPQPQTKEHLMALDIIGIKNVIIAQNKIDVVPEKQIIKNYKEIKAFVKGTVAEKAPIIPVSAQKGVNIDALIQTIEEVIPTPERDVKADPIFLVTRSFDVNKPGTEFTELVGGVLGGSIKQGQLRINDEIIILPGLRTGDKWTQLTTNITSISSGSEKLSKAGPGGSVAIGTELDPALTKSDILSGSVIGLPGKVPPVRNKLELIVGLMKRVVGTKSELEMESIKMNEALMITAWTSRSLGVVTSINKDRLLLNLKLPICISSGEKIALSKNIAGRWRLIGYGVVQ